MIGPARRKPVVCFVDDDPNELGRFGHAVDPHYDVITGTNFAACRQELAQRGLAKPDLWVLDLYFPRDENAPNSPAELVTMNAKYLRLHQATAEFREYLDTIGQGVTGGLALIDNCKRAGGPVVMLTRKGTLEDAIACLDKGVDAVLKKPMPAGGLSADDPQTICQALDAAMLDGAGRLIERFDRAIKAHTHWARHRAAYLWWGGIAVGAAVAVSVEHLLSWLATR